MSRTPSAHWISDSLSKRVPYTDTVHYDPYEISLGYGHQEIGHLLDIIAEPQASRPSTIKALRLLADVLPGREDEAIQLHAFEILKELILQPPNGILLHALRALQKLAVRSDIAILLTPHIPRLVEIIHPEIEVSIRVEACSLLRHMADLIGPVDQFTEGDIPILITVASSSDLCTKPFMIESFRLLSRLTNVQKVRIPIISSSELLKKIVTSILDPDLQNEALNLASNIAMDKSHRGKVALLESDILDTVTTLLKSRSVETRLAALSLIALLAVPKDGKELLSTMPDVADTLKKISSDDPDLQCRNAAKKCRIFVAEIPFGKVIMGDIVDPSKPVPK